MAALYPWFVFAHVVGVVVFAISHGASVFVAFRVRRERDPATIDSLLSVSKLAIGPMYIGLALIILGGLGAAAAADLWFEPWILASVVVLFIVLGVMYSVAMPYYSRLRAAVSVGEAGASSADPTVSAEELGAMLDTRRPEALVTVGTVGLVLLVWLMVIKPG